jgi:hypothetical protein
MLNGGILTDYCRIFLAPRVVLSWCIVTDWGNAPVPVWHNCFETSVMSKHMPLKGEFLLGFRMMAPWNNACDVLMHSEGHGIRIAC